MARCELSEDINNCPFCNKEKMECLNDKTKCAFHTEENIDVANNQYVRKERWYEKYYKTSSFIS